MTVSEAHIAFKIEADKNAVNIGMSGCPSFLPEEIDYWLYSATLSKISTKFTGNNVLQTPFEGNVKRITDLERLIKVDSNINLVSDAISNKLTLRNYSNGNRRLYFISAILNFQGNQAYVNLVNHEQAKRFLQTYTNKPWIENPVAYFENDHLIVLIDKEAMAGPYTLTLTYVEYPKKISYTESTSQLANVPDYMHYEIVKLAASMAIENIESPRVQSNPQFLQISE